MSKSNKLKNVKLKKDTWEVLRLLQIKMELRSIDETIKYIIKKYKKCTEEGKINE